MDFKSQEFLEHIKSSNFSLSWDTNLPESSVSLGSHGVQGCIGSHYYGHEEHQRDIKNKYGIANADFQLPHNGICLQFVINNMKGYEYLCDFTQHYNYKKPELNIVKVKGDLKMPEEFRIAVEENNKKKLLVDNLLEQLEKIAYLRIDDYEVKLIDTDQFYYWTEGTVFPCSYKITERNTEKVKNIWFNTNIMRDC